MGGIVVGQNTNPANGDIYADIYWHSSLFIPHVSVLENTTAQHGILAVRFATSSCRVYPELQTLYWGQVPGQLTGSLCNTNINYTETYQWQVLDVHSTGGWTDISGATTQNYQPPALIKAWLFYRRISKIYNGATLLQTKASSAVSVKLNPFNGGTLSAVNLNVPYNSALQVSPTSVSGGYNPVGNGVIYTWELSINNGPWQPLGSAEAFPGHTIVSDHVSIRRKAQIQNAPLNVPESFRIAYSNVLSFVSFYQTADYENKNYLRENVVLTRGVTNWIAADGLAIDKKIQTTTYLDGLSRPIQTVGKGTHYNEQTCQWWDMVQSITYLAGDGWINLCCRTQLPRTQVSLKIMLTPTSLLIMLRNLAISMPMPK